MRIRHLSSAVAVACTLAGCAVADPATVQWRVDISQRVTQLSERQADNDKDINALWEATFEGSSTAPTDRAAAPTAGGIVARRGDAPAGPCDGDRNGDCTGKVR